MPHPSQQAFHVEGKGGKETMKIFGVGVASSALSASSRVFALWMGKLRRVGRVPLGVA